MTGHRTLSLAFLQPHRSHSGATYPLTEDSPTRTLALTTQPGQDKEKGRHLLTRCHLETQLSSGLIIAMILERGKKQRVSLSCLYYRTETKGTARPTPPPLCSVPSQHNSSGRGNLGKSQVLSFYQKAGETKF